jgi:hypothetical protein
LRKLLERDPLEPTVARRARVELLEALLDASTVDEARVVLAEIDAMAPAPEAIDTALEQRIEAARASLDSSAGAESGSDAMRGAGAR